MELLPILFLLLLFTPPALASTNFRGIPPHDQTYYTSATIWCRDGSNSFSVERLNDDYCDCADGTDEPGTSACSNGRFYCQNKGYTPLFIFSSRVNDGICDCCDGSDEYDGKVNCVNTCSETGKAWRDKLKRRISTFKAGLEVRKQDVKNAKLMMENDKKELANLKLEEKKLKDIVQKLGEKKEEIEKEEEKERVEKEKEEEARKEAERLKVKEEGTKTQPSEDIGEIPEMEKYTDMDTDVEREKDLYNDDGGVDSSEQTSTENLSKDELGRLIASRWTGENPNIEKKDLEEQAHNEHVEDNLNNEEHFQDDNYDEDNDDDDNADTENEREEEAIDDEAEDEHENPELHVQPSEQEVPKDSSIWNKVKSIFKSFSGMYSSPNYTVDKSEADRIRREYHEANSKLNDLRSKISDIQKKLEQDFGKDAEFYNLYGKCFELQENKYTYKICPYKHGVQMEGHSTTTLGKWDGFKDEYRFMQFVQGDRCWNGPDRSLKVRLRCGAEIELRDVDEPSRCEYVAELSTPAVCLEERLAALQQRLHDQGDVPHDEL